MKKLTIIQKGNRIEVYTPEEIELIERRKEIKDNILSSLLVGVVLTAIVLFYVWAFNNFGA